MAEKLSYWERRHLKDKAASVNRAEDYLLKEQQKLYSQASQEIQEEIEKLYQRFAGQQHITLAEAKRQVSGADFRKIDWQGMIDESRDYLSKLPEAETLPGDVVAMMEKQHQDLEAQMALYSRRGRISYLELRKLEIDKKLAGLYDKQQTSIYDFLRGEFDDGYYRGVFDVQQRIGFGKDFVHPNERAIEKAILGRHDKRNYSKTLYAHCKNFSDDLRQNLTVGLIRGEDLDRMASRIHKRMGVASSAARRLVRTETAYIFEEATKEAYTASGIEWYEYLATLDSRTSEACQELDGKHFKVKDAVSGKNYPPMHPNCRSTTVCWFPDEEKKKAATTRDAKDGNGKYYEVPADMTYKQWKAERAAKDRPLDKKDAIADFVKSREDYEKQAKKLAKLEKQSDAMLDAYMDAMDTPQAAALEQAFNKKFGEVENFKQVIKDLQAALSGKEAKAVRQVEKNLAIKAGIPIDKVEMTGLQYDTADMVYKSYKKVLNRYPELKGRLGAFKYDGIQSDAYAGCIAETGEVKAHGLFAKYSDLAKGYAEDVAVGFHPIGTDHNSIIVHELGHALDGYMSKKGLYGGAINRYGMIKDRSAEKIQKEVLSRLGYVEPTRDELRIKGYDFNQISDIILTGKKDFITKHVSEYAADSPAEFFAECFAEYVMSDKPRKAAQIFGEVIDLALGR